MFKLIVKFKGKSQEELEIPSDLEEFVIGREQSCRVVLENTAGISRKHMALSARTDEETGKITWFIKSLSKSSPVLLNGEEIVEETPLTQGALFQVQDYTFQWIAPQEQENASVPGEEPQEPAEKKEEEVEQPPPEDREPAPDSEKASEKEALALFQTSSGQEESPSENALQPLQNEHEQTMMMENKDQDKQLSVSLKVYLKDRETPEIITLEPDKDQWLAGRDLECDITIDDPNMSRKHFKLYRDQNNYFISDQKSANKTILNEKELEPKQKYSLHSGDLIFVLDTEIQFEVKNLALEKELKALKPVPQEENPLALSPEGEQNPDYPPPPPAFMGGPNVIAEAEEPPFWKKNPKKLMIYGGVAFGVLLLALQGGQTKDKDIADKENQVGQSGLAGLTSEQAQMVKDAYFLAKQLYSQGKFVYCKSETEKIHALIESYEDSVNLENACLQASENQQKQYEVNLRKKKEQETNSFIQKVATECEQKFTSFKTKPELVSCLNPAIELSPADNRIQSLIDRFDFNTEQKQQRAQQRAKRKRFIASLMKKYHKAKKLEGEGKVLKAISAYEDFIKVSQHKELSSQRSLAQRELSSIKQNYNSKVSELNARCESEFNRRNYKVAWSICNEGAKIIVAPRNKKMVLFKNKSQTALERMMKPIYEQAALNESTGNIEAAIGLWKKILERDVLAGRYYQMAKTKMKKF